MADEKTGTIQVFICATRPGGTPGNYQCDVLSAVQTSPGGDDWTDWAQLGHFSGQAIVGDPQKLQDVRCHVVDHVRVVLVRDDLPVSAARRRTGRWPSSRTNCRSR